MIVIPVVIIFVDQIILTPGALIVCLQLIFIQNGISLFFSFKILFILLYDIPLYAYSMYLSYNIVKCKNM